MLIQKSSAQKRGYRQAKAITKHHAKTFYMASRFLPKEKRLAAYTVYAICRSCDDSVDRDTTQAQEQLNDIKQRIADAYQGHCNNNALLVAFHQTVNTYNIPKQYFDELVLGMETDLVKNHYKNFDQLVVYCYRVAGVVGLIMLKIFNVQNTDAELAAVALGIAMQLTNILRDVREDLEMGRVYLAQNELKHFGIHQKDLQNGIVTENLRAFLNYQILRTRQYYRQSTQGLAYIDDRSCRFVVCAMKDLYAGILDDIEKHHYDVFSRRAHVNTVEKLWLIGKIVAKGEYR